MQAADGARQLARDRRLADAWKTVDENQTDVGQSNRLHRDSRGFDIDTTSELDDQAA
jgi:hypothetical protein